MDGYTVSMLKGRVFTGEFDALFMPRTPRTGKRGVVLVHGRGATTLNAAQCFLDATSAGLPSGVRMAAYLASNGIPCIAGQFADNPWCNDTHVSRIMAAWSALQSSAGVASDKVCLYGVSMGGGGAVRTAIVHPTQVAAVYGTSPVSNISDIYSNNRGGFQAEIATAWGVTAPAALPAASNLPGNASAASAIPCRLDYGSADTIIIPSTVTALATAWGAKCTATQVDTTNPHGDALFAKTDPEAVRAFFVANGA